MNGYVKLWRPLLEKAIWQQSSPAQATILITLLLMANHKENQWVWKGKKFAAKPGQFVTSAASIIKNCPKGITRQNVRTALAKLKNMDFLTYESTKTGMLVTIINWHLYQSLDEKTNQAVNQDLTNSQPTGNQELTTNEECKNVRSINTLCPRSKITDIHLSLAEYFLSMPG